MPGVLRALVPPGEGEGSVRERVEYVAVVAMVLTEKQRHDM